MYNYIITVIYYIELYNYVLQTEQAMKCDGISALLESTGHKHSN